RLHRNPERDPELRAKIREKQERVARLRAILDTWVLAAPVSGRVERRMARIGHYIDALTPAIALRELPEGTAELLESDAETLREGAAIVLLVEGDHTLTGHIRARELRKGKVHIRFTLEEPKTAAELREPRLVRSRLASVVRIPLSALHPEQHV